MKLAAKKIRRGLYRVVGMVCWGDEIYGPCGGELHIESEKADGTTISDDPDFKWETFCTKCKTCDCDGWPTLTEALENAETAFGRAT